MMLTRVSRPSPHWVSVAFLLLLLSSCSDTGAGPSPGPSILPVQFPSVNANAPDTVRTLESLSKVGDLFVMTYYGDYSARLEGLNERIIEHGIGSVIPTGAFGHECSIFSGLGEPGLPILGRNLDNNTRRGVLAGLYRPPDGYASMGISNMYHLGYGPSDDPTQQPLETRGLLLNSVLFVDDGVNERGVSIALASVEPEAIVRDPEKRLVTVSYAVREVLDHAGNLQEAVEIIQNMDVFDQNVTTISHHFLIADANGQSAVAEYDGGSWRILWNEDPWQVATNTKLFGRSKDWVKNQCSRYRAGDRFLEDEGGAVTWEEGLEVLELMSRSDTQWSSVYDLAGKEAYLCLHRKCETIFHLRLGS